MHKKFLDQCPYCHQLPIEGRTTFSGQIDERGIAVCSRCGRTVTREVLYSYWESEDKKFKLAMLRALEKKWWQFWK